MCIVYTFKLVSTKKSDFVIINYNIILFIYYKLVDVFYLSVFHIQLKIKNYCWNFPPNSDP